MIAFLHGGSPGRDFEFYRNVVDFKNVEVKVAIIPFATKDRNLWSDIERYFISMLTYVNPNHVFTTVGVDNRNFDSVDLMFVPGGNGDILKCEVEKRSIFSREVFFKKDVVYVGNSAGVNLLSKLYYSNDNKRIDQGLGLHNVATFCHYSADKYRRLNELVVAAQMHGIKEIIPLGDDEYIDKEVLWYSRLDC